MKKHYLLMFFIIITINFFLPRLMPGDPFLFLSVEDGDTSARFTDKQVEQYKEYYGLDKPLIIQYKDYILNLFKGNLGFSIYYNQSVVSIISSRAIWTLLIVIASLILSVIVGVFLGSISAWYRNGYFDKWCYGLMVMFSQIPSFLIGVIFLFTIASKVKWIPLAGGMSAFAKHDSFLGYAYDIFRHGLLPIITLSL